MNDYISSTFSYIKYAKFQCPCRKIFNRPTSDPIATAYEQNNLP